MRVASYLFAVLCFAVFVFMPESQVEAGYRAAARRAARAHRGHGVSVTRTYSSVLYRGCPGGRCPVSR